MEYSEQVEVISGTVADVTYQNIETGFTVLELECDNSLVTAVGIMPEVAVGEMLELGGRFDNHAIYGRQFKVISFVKSFPSDSAAILRYLSSGTIKGIGPATAKRIVAEFQDDTFETLLNHPEMVAKIKGITLNKAEEISREMKNRTSMRDTLHFFAPYGFTTEEILNIYGVFQDSSIEIVKNNPYLICHANIGISFTKADDFAKTLGIPNDFNGRISAAVLYILSHNLSNGHTCLPLSKLVPIVSSFLGLDEEFVYPEIEKLCLDGQTVLININGEDLLFLREYFEAESFISERLSIARSPLESFSVSDTEISLIEEELNIEFEKMQRRAIKSVGESGILVLTGGPGTGKTTVLNAIIKVLEAREFKISLAAPTGRAAKRMTEVTGKEAKTIHRLLEVEKIGGEHRFKKCEKDMLDCDVLIIDEMSMVDSALFAATLKAIRLDCRIILVGDHNQLPSVGAGNILQDILTSEKFNWTRLETVFRQALESDIIVNSHKAVKGEKLSAESNGNDFFIIEIGNPVAAAKYITDLCTRRLCDAYNVSVFDGIQVLCPSRKMRLGTEALNSSLQNIVNPPDSNKKEMTFQGYLLREGDKVMQVKNNYDIMWQKDNGEIGIGVFNGDIGTVISIDKLNRCMKIRFDDKTADYLADDIYQLELAYAVTVHKSQGREFDYVVIPVADVPSKLKYRNLLYTGMTRAKKMLILVGSTNTVNEMIENDRKTLRYTGLCEFLRGQ